MNRARWNNVHESDLSCATMFEIQFLGWWYRKRCCLRLANASLWDSPTHSFTHIHSFTFRSKTVL